VHVQPTKLSDAQAPPTSWLGRGTRGLQTGGDVHKEAVHLLSLQPVSGPSLPVPVELVSGDVFIVAPEYVDAPEC